MTGNVAPQHGKCQAGRTDYRTGNGREHNQPCPNRAEPDRFYCLAHGLEARARMQDRAIGDARARRWSTWTTIYSRGGES